MESLCCCKQPSQSVCVPSEVSSCCGGCAERYRIENATCVQQLRFSFKNLLYSIENLAYVEGDVMQLPLDHEHARHPVIDVGQDGNRDRVRRVLDLAFAEVTDALFPYTKRRLEEGAVQRDDLVETDEYVLELSVPIEFSETTLLYLERLIHEYAVACVLSDWMAITNPSARERWDVRKVEVLAGIRDNLGGRMRKRRRKPSVF